VFYFAKLSINEASKNSLAIARSLYQGEKIKQIYRIKLKKKVQGTNCKNDLELSLTMKKSP